MELAKHLPSSIHRYVMNLEMTENEEHVQKIEREVTFNIKKQTWNVKFVITSAGAGGVITFSTNPACILQKTHRIICSLLIDSCEGNVITLGGNKGTLCKPLGFFDWSDIKHFLKLNREKDKFKICFDIIEIFPNYSAITSFNSTDLNVLPFFESGDYSDVTIKTSRKEFKVHKLVLAAQSPVFAAMFKNDMQEASTGKVMINNVKTEVLEEMLRYMYSKDSVKLSEMPCQLYAAAHMYDVQDLQKLCVDHLLLNIRVDNVVEILKLCDMYVLENVKEHVLKFIDNNEEVVIKRKEYLVYLKENISMENLTKNLMIAHKHELTDFKLFVMDFIAKNYAKVMQNQEYRLMYSSSTSMKLILEVDEYIANYIAILQHS